MQISDEIDDSAQGRRRTLTFAGLALPWPFPLARGLYSSSSAMVFGYPVFGANAPLYVWGAFRVLRRVKDGIYWLRYRFHPRYRFHVVKTGLAPNYYDCDTLMLHACMALLCQHVEDQGGADQLEKWTAELREPGSEGHGPREAVESQADRQSEVLTIYRWWKVQKPAEQKRSEELLHELYGKRSRVSWKPTDNPSLSEMVFEEFEGDEIAKEQEYRALEKKIDDDEQMMLHRLIDIRRSLWD